MRDSTEDEARIRDCKRYGFYPEVMEALTEDNDNGFGIDRLGFLTLRWLWEYRRLKLAQLLEDFDEWFGKHSNIIGELVKIEELRHAAKIVLVIWRDIFVSDIRDMPKTDLITYRILTYKNVVPRVAKPVLYTKEETDWQKEHLLKLVAAGVMTQCESPWAARSRFVRKLGGGLRMVHVFCSINDAIVKSNYLMRRIEPILQFIV